MQAIISMEDVTAGQLLSMNRSVDQMVNAAARLEMILQAKWNWPVSCAAFRKIS